MADISVQKKNGADLSWVWAAAAIVAIIGLMAWLIASQPPAASVAPEAEESAAVEVPETTAEVVDLGALGGAPDQYVGQQVRVENVPVAAVLGNRGFWADVQGGNPLLVILEPEVGDAPWVSAGETATLTGTVQPVSEDEVDAWVQRQYIETDARAQAAFATHYLQVTNAAP